MATEGKTLVAKVKNNFDDILDWESLDARSARIRNLATGEQFIYDRSSAGLHRFRRADGTPVGGPNIPISFGDNLGGARLGNITAQLGNMLGVDLRNRQLPKARLLDNTNPPDKRNGSSFASTAPDQESETMSPTAEMSPIVESRPVSDVVDEILKDPEFSRDLLVEQVNRRARRDNSRRHELGGTWYYDWHGDLLQVMRAIWPALPADRKNPIVVKLQLELLAFVRQDGALASVRDTGGRTLWRVRDDGKTDIAPPEDTHVDTEPTPQPAPAVKPQQAATPAVPAPAALADAVKATPGAKPEAVPVMVDGVEWWTCTVCPYREASRASVIIHINRTKGEHSQAEYPCRHCPTICTVPQTFVKHCKEKHGDEGYADKIMCHEHVGEWYDGPEDYRRHLNTVPHAHRRPVNPGGFFNATKTSPPPASAAVAQPTPVIATPPATTAPVEESVVHPTTPATPEPASAPARNVAGMSAVAAEAVRMISEYPALRAKVSEQEETIAELRQRLDEATRARVEAEDTLAGIRKMLGH